MQSIGGVGAGVRGEGAERRGGAAAAASTVVRRALVSKTRAQPAHGTKLQKKAATVSPQLREM